MSIVRPIVIYPFRHPENTKHLNALYWSLDQKCKADPRYDAPTTVINRQTFYRSRNNKSFTDIYQSVKQQSSSIVDAWCVDTCQMWLAGFGSTFDRAIDASEEIEEEDIFWLIPGDFDYASDKGQEVLKNMYLIPESIMTDSEFCIGQLEMHPNSSKHLIDTYGTYGLLFNWFPAEAYEMRKIGIIRPRSEFFAIHHRFLRGALIDHRWFAYEQTIALLLQAGDRRMSTVSLGGITDPSESRDSLTGALQQIERTERVLKVAWRDKKMRDRANDWVKDFRILEERSKEIIGAAITILNNSLTHC
ncbi:MAG: hypothetical protein PVI92_09625 [Chromatiales bacterium]|jgi:hypothetical protein